VRGIPRTDDAPAASGSVRLAARARRVHRTSPRWHGGHLRLQRPVGHPVGASHRWRRSGARIAPPSTV